MEAPPPLRPGPRAGAPGAVETSPATPTFSWLLRATAAKGAVPSQRSQEPGARQARPALSPGPTPYPGGLLTLPRLLEDRAANPNPWESLRGLRGSPPPLPPTHPTAAPESPLEEQPVYKPRCPTGGSCRACRQELSASPGPDGSPET